MTLLFRAPEATAVDLVCEITLGKGPQRMTKGADGVWGQQRRGTVIIHGLGWHDSDPGILRNLGGTVAAAFQGDGGAPFFFTTNYT